MPPRAGEADAPKAAGRRAGRKSLAALVLVIATVAALLVYRHFTAWPPTDPDWQPWVVTFAGDGAPGTADGSLTTARFSDPFGLAVAPDGTIYVADAGESNRIRAITPEGLVTTLAGGDEGFADGSGPAARFHTPSGLAIDRTGALVVADTGNHAIRRVLPDGTVETLAGTGAPGYRDGPGTAAQFDGPLGVALDAQGRVYVADTYNDRIRRIDREGVVATIAGTGAPGFADGPAAAARFDTPSAVAVALDGGVVVADTGNHAIRRIAADGTVSTLGTSPDGGPVLRVRYPLGLTLTHDGYLYATGSGEVVQVAPDGGMRTLAGAGAGWADGRANEARFNTPAQLAVDRRGHVYLADPGSFVVRALLSDARPAGRSLTAEAEAAPFDERPATLPRLDAATLGLDPLPWPLDPQDGWHEVVGTVGEPRGQGDGRDRFHAGIDVRAPDGTIVRAVQDDKVRHPIAVSWFESTSESFAAGLFSYVHLRVGRDRQGRPLDPVRFPFRYDAAGEPTGIRVRRGTRIYRGDALGTVNRLYHVQLDLGPRGAAVNPLVIGLAGLDDDVPPTIEPDGVQLADAGGTRLAERRRGRLLVREPVRIIVYAYDRVNRNEARRRLGLYRLGYQILRPDGTPADGFETPLITMEFDRLPADPGAARLAFAPGSGVAVHRNAPTRYGYVVTNTVRHGHAAEGLWDPNALPAGDYVVRIIAEDHAGNAAVARRDLAVTVERADEPS